jgi:predicted permease
MTNLTYTLDIVGPVFLTILLGFTLRRASFVNDDFVRRTSQLVFYVGLPALIVGKMADAPIERLLYPGAALLFVAGTLLFFGLSWLLAPLVVSGGPSRGAFVQGCFRGNIAIVGLSIVSSMMDKEATTAAVFLLAFSLPLYNILAVVVLTTTTPREGRTGWKALLREIALNPPVLAVAAGLAIAALPFRLPSFVLKTFTYLGDMTLPLALIGIGAGLSISSVLSRLTPTLWAVVIKNIATPALMGWAAWALGLGNAMTALLFVVTAAPTAVSSFVMVKAMDGDADLAAAIVMATTLASALTLTVGILALRSLGIV